MATNEHGTELTTVDDSKAVRRFAIFGWIVAGSSLLMFWFFRSINKDSQPVLILIPFLYVNAIIVYLTLHMRYRLGKSNWWRFLLTVCLLSYLAEGIGVNTGYLFGHYYYTALAGPQLPGQVPVLIPLVWFFMLYCALCTAELFLFGIKGRQARVLTARERYLLLPGLTAVLMTIWDLAMDLRAVFFGAWVWPEGGSYYGIPLSNFRDWFLVSYVVSCLYLLWEAKTPQGSINKRKIVYTMPVHGYNFAFLNNLAGCLQNGRYESVYILLVIWLAITILTLQRMFKT